MTTLSPGPGEPLPVGTLPGEVRPAGPMRWLVRLLEGVVIALMAVIVTAVIIEVALRWLAGGASLIITDELTRYLMIWVAMLGAALLVHEDGHIRISTLPDVLPPTARFVCQVLSCLVALFFLVTLIVISTVNLPDVVGQKTITLGISMAYFSAALPVGGALMALFVITDLARLVRRFFRRSRAQPTSS